MSLVKLNKSLFETSTIVLRKSTTYISGSSTGVTRGSLTASINPIERISIDSSSRIAGGGFSDELSDIGQNIAIAGAHFRAGDGSPGSFPYFHNGQGITDTTSDYLENIRVLPSRPHDIRVKYISASFFDYDSTHISFIGNTDTFATDGLGYPNAGKIFSFPATDPVEAYKFALSANFCRNDVRTDLFSQITKVINGTVVSSDDLSFTAYGTNADSDEVNFLNLNAAPGSINDLGTKHLLAKSDLKKQVINILMPYYKARYNNSDFSYTNFNCLNFYYDSSRHTGKEVLVYENSENPLSKQGVAEEFFVSFWINPRYKQDTPHAEFGNGTILHVSSSLAISLVTGSSFDNEGYTDKFRIALQLSSSADVNPNNLVFNSTNRPTSFGQPNDMIMITDDNLLERNKWHYVSAKWGASSNDRNVTLRVNDKKLNFKIDSGSLGATKAKTSGTEYVFLGNYFDGVNTQIPKFFSENNALINFAKIDSSSGDDDIPIFNVHATSSCPLQSEIHEVRMHAKYLNDDLEERYRYTSFPHRPRMAGDGTDYVNHNNERLNFYLPPWYDSVVDKNIRLATHDGYMPFNPSLYVGPFERYDNLVTSPTNVMLSNGIGGKYINVHNFTRNIGNGRLINSFYASSEIYSQPIHFNMSASLTSHELMSNASALGVATREYFYDQASVRRRNTLITPCDNGDFIPDYYFPKNDDKKFTTHRNANQIGVESYETINLTEVVSGSLTDDPILPNDPNRETFLRGLPLSYLTTDRSSNDISIFSISNLYYGERIHPGSLSIKDPNLSGSHGKLSFTLKDDGRGSLYRADSDGNHAKWASVGNVFYDEGVILVKTPHLPYFGKEGYRLDFKGEQSTHVTTLHVPCPEEMFISSSNPTYQFLTASNLASDEDNPFVYITGVNIHDDKLNVIMKANLAQPIKKRKTDSFLFRLKQDY